MAARDAAKAPKPWTRCAHCSTLSRAACCAPPRRSWCSPTAIPKARVMFVGEAPGRDEDIAGMPFVGRSGKLLDRMMAAIGLDRSKAYIANIVPWRPPGNRTPTPHESAICLPFIRRQIELADPDILVCLGQPSTQTLLGTREGITRTRGRWFKFDTGTPRDPRARDLSSRFPAAKPAAEAARLARFPGAEKSVGRLEHFRIVRSVQPRSTWRRRRGALAGLITPQPINNGGKRPRTGRANVCGTSGTRSGKRALISGGGAGSVPAAGQTITAPLSRMSRARDPRRGRGIGIENRRSAGSARRARPVRRCVDRRRRSASDRPVRRAKLSAKKRPMAVAGCATLSSVPAVHGNITITIGTQHRRHQQQPGPGQAEDALMMKLDAVAGSDDDGEAGQRQKRRAPPTGKRSPTSTATIVASSTGPKAKTFTKSPRMATPASARWTGPAGARAAAIRKPARQARSGRHERERARRGAATMPPCWRPRRRQCAAARQAGASVMPARFEPEMHEHHAGDRSPRNPRFECLRGSTAAPACQR